MKIAYNLFKNSAGKTVIWQFPNLPLWGWLITSLLAKIYKDSSVHSAFSSLTQAFLFTWSYLELRSGESLFRRILGAIVVGVTVYGIFR